MFRNSALFILILVSIYSFFHFKSETGPTVSTIPWLKFAHELHGLPFFEDNGSQSFSRLPLNDEATFSELNLRYADFPAGVRLRFRTNSKKIKIHARSNYAPYAVLIDGKLNSVGGRFVTHVIYSDEKMKDVEIHFPFEQPFQLTHIEFDEGAKVEKPHPLPSISPTVYYGSSITQGIAAGVPSDTFPAVVSRELDGRDFINLGFAGSGLGEIEMAELVASLPASVFVLDFWANPSVEQFKNNLPSFIQALQKKNKKTPIVVTTPIWNMQKLEAENAAKKEIVEKAVSGLENVFIHDWSNVLSKEDVPDGRHPNKQGNSKMAQSLLDTLRRIDKSNSN